MEEILKQNKNKSNKEFEKLLYEDLENRKFKEGEIKALWELNTKEYNNLVIVIEEQQNRPQESEIAKNKRS